MKRLVLSILTSLALIAVSLAQEMTVKNFELVPNDITASIERRNDANNEACALLKVQLAQAGATFHGNVVGEVSYSQSEYRVYMTEGSKRLQVRLDGYLPLDIEFAGFKDVGPLKSLTTYKLVLELPFVGNRGADRPISSFFVMTVRPANASVRIDGVLQTLNGDGSFSKKLDPGTHTYLVEAGGYEPQQETFTMGSEKKSVTVNLVSSMATLNVECETSGADIYLNDSKVGSQSRWTGTLTPADYVVEARKQGYYPQQKTISLGKNQVASVKLPALSARVGLLEVNYNPVNADVLIDGVKKGLSPDVFRDLTVGGHRVEIQKDGYEPQTVMVEIKEGETSLLSGSLTSLPSASSAISGAAASTGTGATSGRETFTVNGVTFAMVRVAGGTFTMGATSEQGSDAYDSEKPTHEVTLSPYSIGETEVTQELWEAVMGNNPSNFKGSKRPVEWVSWDDCQEFIRKLNAATGKEFRLPTEAEWEYAARGGNRSRGYKYSGSNTIGEVAWFTDNSGSTTHNVATKQPNELGLYDMSGNVYEWCSDWYGKDYYSSSAQGDPKDPNSGSVRVFRGGSWGDIARFCRSSRRDYVDPGFRHFLGLRLALSE